MCFDVLRGDHHVVFIAGLVHRDGFGGQEWTVALSAPLEDVWTGCSSRALARPITIVWLIRLTPLFLVICYQLLKQRFELHNKNKIALTTFHDNLCINRSIFFTSFDKRQSSSGKLKAEKY